MRRNQTVVQWCVRLMLLAGVIVLSASSIAAQEVPDNPVTWTLTTKEKLAALKPGSAFNAQLTAKIEGGWHLYSLDQPDGGPKPTRVVVPTEQVFELADSIESPQPIKKHDENFGMETEFFESAVTFTLPVRVAANAPAGQHKLKVEVRFQTCSEQFCLPPKTVKLELAVEVASK